MSEIQMSEIGTASHPLRVAIVGSGPAGFYTVSHLLKQEGMTIEIDMFEKLPTPFGLVRAGVAPDHQKDKSVTRAYDRSAASDAFRFYGNVEFGRHLHLDDIRRHYHQIVFATGAQDDRSLEIPGEEATGSHPATDFVAWYNGHPDYAEHRFNLDATDVAIIGLGNVAIDVARMLCRRVDDLATTDMADHALQALRNSRVNTVTILGRRGPAQAAFTPEEIRELGALEGTDVVVRPEEAELDEVSRQALAISTDRNATRNAEIIREYSQWQSTGRDRQLNIRFMVSPLEIITDDAGQVAGIRIVRNESFAAPDGSVRVRATSDEEVLPVQMVFRSVGYRGVKLPGIPFDERAGLIPNRQGRVLDEQQHPIDGLYVVGWIKRGPSGVIGSNKTDARETVACMIEDAVAGRLFAPPEPEVAAARALVESRQQQLVSYAHWQELDSLEVHTGVAADVEEMLRVLER